MSGLVVLGLLWGGIGIALGMRWWTEREQPSGHHTGREQPPGTRVGLASSTRFGRATESRSEHRRQAMLLAYAAGTTLVALGFLVRAALPLALGAALVNLGTLYRYLVLLLDESEVEQPETAAAGVGPAHRRARQPIVSRLLVGDLAK